MRGTLTLQEISTGILDYVSTTISAIEISYMEKLFMILKKKNILHSVKDMMNFLNFNRDYSCSQEQFRQVLRQNF